MKSIPLYILQSKPVFKMFTQQCLSFVSRTTNLFPVFVISIAVLLRVALLLLGWPNLNSDEATMGLAALHIAYQGAHPWIFYGQNYMGTLEAYMAAVSFHIFGVSLFSLRIGMVVLFCLFLISMYLLMRLLSTPIVALITITLLTFGNDEMLYRQLSTNGGRMETLLLEQCSF